MSCLMQHHACALLVMQHLPYHTPLGGIFGIATEKLHRSAVPSIGLQPCRLPQKLAACMRRAETPAPRAHAMFTQLGLRHLVVTNDANAVTGIISRRDLDHAAGHGAWRRNRMAPPPEPATGVLSAACAISCWCTATTP